MKLFKLENAYFYGTQCFYRSHLRYLWKRFQSIRRHRSFCRSVFYGYLSWNYVHSLHPCYAKWIVFASGLEVDDGMISLDIYSFILFSFLLLFIVTPDASISYALWHKSDMLYERFVLQMYYNMYSWTSRARLWKAIFAMKLL